MAKHRKHDDDDLPIASVAVASVQGPPTAEVAAVAKAEPSSPAKATATETTATATTATASTATATTATATTATATMATATTATATTATATTATATTTTATASAVADVVGESVQVRSEQQPMHAFRSPAYSTIQPPCNNKRQ
jgi:hypothetical protein